LGARPATSPRKNPIPLKMLNYGKPDGRIIDDQSEYQGIRKKELETEGAREETMKRNN
jgi:hypothetical protein